MTTLSEIKKTFQLGDQTVTLSTGEIARHANGAVMAQMGDTVILATVVGAKTAKPGIDFFPLTVDYQERTYAAGRLPGGYFKREGRPAENGVLAARQLDRSFRPLFPDGFRNEVQIIVTVLSLDIEIEPDIISMLGASAALAISGIPFNGPVGASRVAYVDGQYVLNPTRTQLAASALDLVVAGTEEAVLMVESEAKELSEEVMLGAVMFGHHEMQTAIQAIKALAAEAGKPAWDWQPPAPKEALATRVANCVEAPLRVAYQVREKLERLKQISELRATAIAQLCTADVVDYTPEDVKQLFSDLESQIVRNTILEGKPRIDGRDTKTVRPIQIRTGVLPRTHGSALFTRGETQALVVTTLGTGRDAQKIETLQGTIEDRFMLHYNFPPFSVGETGMVGSPKRREIGHGRLAKRALLAVLPERDQFDYVLRVVSEITDSNGSSSMASACGTSLALMDAGVPIKSPVAGIAMGLIKEGDRFAILTDILGDEDHLGDMDFKVAGTASGVTALQMDIKINGITREIMEQALAQAKEGRLHILNIMNAALARPREAMSMYAPRIITIKIDPEKIRDVIGKGGAVIRSITEETGAVIDITDDGTVKIASSDDIAAQAALRRIHLITADVEVGAIYEGKVVKLMDFGAFVTVLPGRDGLVHISQVCHERIDHVSSKLSEGQSVRVKVLEVDKQGRIRLTMKDVDATTTA